MRNEAQTRFELIDPVLIDHCGWRREDIRVEHTAAQIDIVKGKGVDIKVGLVYQVKQNKKGKKGKKVKKFEVSNGLWILGIVNAILMGIVLLWILGCVRFDMG